MIKRNRHRLILLAVLLVLMMGGWVAVDWYVAMPPGAVATYVGRASCVECHQEETHLWNGSHHDRAMEVADESTVLGDFDDAEFTRFGVTTRMFRRGGEFWVNTEGPDGQMHDYQVKYTFGYTPLQQYMVELDKGRVQVLRVSWNTERKEWFYVTPPDATEERFPPDDPLHWTGISQNWNTMCAECHSTNLQKNYNLREDSYQTTYSEIDVSCEACHGPGSLHVEIAESHTFFWDRNLGDALPETDSDDETWRQIETCAPCHSRRSMVHADYHARTGKAGDRYADYFNPSLLSPGLYHADGQILDEVYVYGSFLQSKMHSESVRCTDCHDPHSLRVKFDDNRLCAQCHEPEKYDTESHHHHEPGTDGAACVECHMPEQYYMVVDPRRDHSIRVPRPDLSLRLGTPNACNFCHVKPEESVEWAAEAVRDWYGDPAAKEKLVPHYGVAIDAGRRGTPEGLERLENLLARKYESDFVHATAVELLGNYDAPEATVLCRRALKHDNPLVRAAAVRASAGKESNELVQAVAKLLDDPVRIVRMAAAHRLAGYGRQLTRLGFGSVLDRAIQEYRKAQEVMSERAGAHINLAYISIQQGQLDDAVESLRNAIRLEPYLTGPRGELARILEQFDTENREEKHREEIRRLRTEEADLLARDCKLLPQNAALRYQRGMLLYLLGEHEQALTMFREACRLDPNSYPSHLALALLCEKMHLWDEAARALVVMEKQRPGDPAVRGIFTRMKRTMESEENSKPEE